MAEGRTVTATARTMLGVTLVTVLVWIFAEGESLKTERFGARAGFLASDPEVSDVIIEASAGWSGAITVELEGSNTALGGLDALFERRIELTPGAFGGLVPSEPGEHVIDLAQVISRMPGIAEQGVRVLSVQPERVSARVIRMTDVELPVVTRLPSGSQGQASATPEIISARMPEGLARRLGADAIAIARVDRSAIDGLAPGRAVTLSDVVLELPLALVGEPYVEPSRRQVNVTVRVEAQTDRVTLRSVPVWIRRPAFNADRLILSLPAEDQTIASVEVSGPSPLISQIRDGALRVFATVEVPAELLGDLREQRTMPVTLNFEQIDGRLEFSSSKRTVRLTARPILDGQPVGGGAPASREEPSDPEPAQESPEESGGAGG